MKNKTNFKKESCVEWFFHKFTIKSIVLIAFAGLSIQATLQAQDIKYTRPTWKFGAAAGANFNFYRGSTQKLNANFTSPSTFHDGNGLGLYIAPVIEYHRPNSLLGVMLQAGYDNRKGTFNQIVTPCNCPADLDANLSYITVEPSLRFAPFKSNFYLYAGPRFAFIRDKSFTYQLGINPAYPDQAVSPEVSGDLSDVNKSLVSMQIGAGYDIPLSSNNQKTQFTLSPYAAFHPYFGQDPRSIETLNITTVRAGVVLKFGQGREIPQPVKPVEIIEPVKVVVLDEPNVKFTVDSPKNATAERRVSEEFPLLNSVFFNIGSTEISNRYKLLKKDEVKSFRKDQFEMAKSVNKSGRSERQMKVYYNVINILGYRMLQNPSTNVSLVGLSNIGPQDGKEMAESVKTYLVDVFGINSLRISTRGQYTPSKTVGNTKELELLSEKDRRVSIESGSPVLLNEFRNDPNEGLNSLEVIAAQEAPITSYITFNVKGATEAFTSWSLQITDSEGVSQNFGPYTEESVSIPSASILGTRAEGNYKVKMTGQTKAGNTIVKETTSQMTLWAPAKIEKGMTFSIIFEFDKSKATPIYEKYLTDVVSPKIPINGKVIIHGHADIIGDAVYNQKLSMERTNEVKRIIEKSLLKSGRNDVKFELLGSGEDENAAPFRNKYPEERSYNRTVIINIIPN